MKKIIIYTVCVLLASVTYAQDSLNIDRQMTDSIGNFQDSQMNPNYNGSTFTKAMADSAYMNNDFTTAIQIYQSLLKDGEAAEIYYNLGNSYYKAGDIAKAILNYERALLLKPGNDDIRANLEIARAKTVDKVEVIPDIFFIGWIKSLINSTSVDVWARWGIAFFVLFIVGLYFFFFSRKITYKKAGFIGAIVCLICVISVNIFAYYQKSTLVNRNTAIIISPSVTVKSTPNESGTNLFILHEGHKVTIKDNSMKNWKEISLEDGKIGWLPASDMEVI